MKPPFKTLFWEDNRLFIIDQRLLPHDEEVVELKDAADVWNAIQTLQVRGAPAIGCVAAYGVALSAINGKKSTVDDFISEVAAAIKYLSGSRPTAYNLFYALDKMSDVLIKYRECGIKELKFRLLEQAEAIYRQDLECCYKIGLHGAELIRDNDNILTHCNAGGLATSGFGTALSLLFAAKSNGRKFHVFVDETRPVLQGARLTAWELKKTDIDYTLICDNMAGYLMQQGRVDRVIVGADRIAANGDTANKIGTYSLAVLAFHHKIDFYVAAPSSTFDKSLKRGDEIIIEERAPEEVGTFSGKIISPEDTSIYNPAFDITPAKFITAFITENGIIRGPYIE